jgi:hypothetical protein
MTHFKQPSKEQVREYLKRRLQARTPPPDPEQIKRELGILAIDVNQSRKFRL